MYNHINRSECKFKEIKEQRRLTTKRSEKIYYRKFFSACACACVRIKELFIELKVYRKITAAFICNSFKCFFKYKNSVFHAL